MKTQFLLRKTINFPTLVLIAISTTSFFLSACSSSYELGAPVELGSADDMMKGPGVFSGDKGGYTVAGGKEKVVTSKPVSTMSATETSKAIDERLEQLKRDQIELEALKRDLNKKLKN